MSKRKMRGVLLASSLLCFGMIAGTVVSCGEQVAKVPTKISISNKTELGTTWYAKTTTRELKLSVDVDGYDISAALADGTITFASSDASVIAVDSVGKLTSAKAGTAKITVTLGELTDTVDLTVVAGPTTVTVANKEALVKEWHALTDNREIKIEVDIATFNITTAIREGVLKIVSSDPSVVSVQGRYLSALKAGTTKITVSVADVKDSFDLTILDKVVEKDVITGKTVADLFDLPKADKTQLYEVEGYISDYDNGKTSFGEYGNFMLVDDLAKPTEKPILVYGCTATAKALVFGANGQYSFTNPKDFDKNEKTKSLKLYDKVRLKVYRDEYNGKKELVGLFLEKTGEGTPSVIKEPSAVEGKTITDIATDAKAFVGGVPVLKYTKVKGKVKAFKSGSNGGAYGNLTITDGTTDLPLYGMTATATSLTWNEGTGKYVFKNPADYMKNDLTASLLVGQDVVVDLVRADFTNNDGVTTIQGSAILVSRTEIEPTKITLAGDIAEITAGVDTAKVTPTTEPVAISVPLTYVSSDESIATVDAKGVVTGLKAGVVKITAKYKEVVSNEVSITVKEVIAPTAIVIAGETAVGMEAGTKKTFTATTTPEVINVPLVWKSSDETVLKFGENGEATALKAGEAKVTAEYGEVKSAEVTVTVTGTAVVVSTIEFSQSDIGMTIDKAGSFKVGGFDINYNDQLKTQSKIVSTNPYEYIMMQKTNAQLWNTTAINDIKKIEVTFNTGNLSGSGLLSCNFGVEVVAGPATSNSVKQTAGGVAVFTPTSTVNYFNMTASGGNVQVKKVVISYVA